MKRGIILGLGVAVLLAASGVFYLLSNLDSAIQAAVENFGSEITQTQVKLDQVELDLTSGQGALRGFSVGNPAGFKTPTAFRMGAVSVTVDTGTVTEKTVVIREVIIDSPDVTYELSGDGNNMDAIRANVDAYMAKHGLAGDGAKKEDSGGGPRLIIENLYIRGGTVNVSASLLQGRTMTAPLPDIHLKDIGKEEGGASPGEVAEQILKSISDGAQASVGGLGVGKTLDSLKSALRGLGAEGVGKALGDATGGLTGSAGEATQSITEGAVSGAEEAGKALKGLLGN
jgi:hypothetical protein